MEEKYIKLLLTKCLNFDKSKILLISYDVVNKDFVNKLVIIAKSLGVEEVYLDESDINLTKKKLQTQNIDQIKNDKYFDKSIWDYFASLNASFLMLETEFPDFLKDIDEELIGLTAKIKRQSRPLFREKEAKNEIPWVIAALPNIYWAKDIFPTSINPLESLTNAIYKMCMIDAKDPSLSWDQYLKKAKKRTTYLNSLKIKSLSYKNNLGTNLTVSYNENTLWSSVADDLKYNMLVNMPSYEIFTSPNYLSTTGIVYSSRPLIYNGAKIDEFFLEFKDGKVINYDAKVGKQVLRSIIESDSNSCYLGETALVNYDSPISNTNLIFKTTLFDENASCHLALGAGFPSSITGGERLGKEELLNQGINQSATHVDFMIGTPDLSIIAKTEKGEVEIFRNGNFTF